MEPATHAAASGACNEVTMIPLEFFMYTDLQLSKENAAPVSDRWVYVFKRHSWGTTLYAELFIDDGGNTSLVNWQGQHWANRDERPANVERETFEVSYRPDRYELTVFLSRVQLARDRIEAYTGESGLEPVVRRGMHFDPEESAHIEPMDADCAGCHVYLIDHIRTAQQLHARYHDALSEYAAFISDDDSTSRQLLATLTLNVAEQVEEDESDVWSWLDADGNTLRREVQNYSNRRENLEEAMESRAASLTQWMQSPVYQELLFDYTGTEALEDEGHDLQAELCDGLSQSTAGRSYLDRVLQDRDSWHNQLVVPAGTHAFAVADKAIGTVGASLKFIKEFAGGIARQSMDEAVSFIYYAFRMRFDLTVSLHVLLPGGGTMVWREMTYTRFVEAQAVGVRVDVDAVERALQAGQVRDAAAVREVGVNRIVAVVNIVNLALAGKGLAEARTGRERATAVIALAGACADSTAAIAGLMRQTNGVRFVGTSASIAGGVLTYAGAIPEIASSSYEGNWGLVAGWSAVAFGGALGAASGASAAGAGTLVGIGATGIGLIAVAFALGGVALIWAFSESPFEEWFKQCPWGTDPSGRSVSDHLEQLLGLIGRPRFRLGQVGSDRVRLVLQPTFAMPGQTRFDVNVTITRVTYRRQMGKYTMHNVRESATRVGTVAEAFPVRTEEDMERIERTVSVSNALSQDGRGANTWTELNYEGTITARFLDGMEDETFDVDGTL